LSGLPVASTSAFLSSAPQIAAQTSAASPLLPYSNVRIVGLVIAGP
jgi:hypothetical protein